MKIRVRVDAPAYEKFIQFLQSKDVDVIASCYECPSNENPHYHLFAEVNGSIDALKRARSRYFSKDATMKGNGVASIQEMDKEQDYMEYMCKGVTVVKDPATKMYYGKCDPQLVINSQHWDIKELHERFWQRHKADKPKRHKNFTLKLLEDWEKLHLSDPDEFIPSRDDIECIETVTIVPVQLDIETHVVDWLIDYLGTENKPWDKYMVVRYMNLIIFKYRRHFSTRSCKRAQQHVKHDILHSLGLSVNRLLDDDELFVEKYLS